MRSFRHWTPTYLRDRVALAIRHRRHPDEPWLTAEAVNILASWLRSTDVGLELGSGRSTPWLAARLARLTSVEHDPIWFQRTSARLSALGLAQRTDYRLCPDGKNGASESSYVKVISGIADATLDVVLVDGVARDDCAHAALDKLKPGGLLVIDNINWFLPRRHPSTAPRSRSLADGFETPRWQSVAHRIADWRVIWTSDGICDTALWTKPPA